MAREWRPTQKALDRYDELVKQQNKLRRQLLRRRKKVEETSDSGRLPSLIIPAKGVKSIKIDWRQVGAKEFRRKMKMLSNLVTGGLQGWYKRNYKDAILLAWRQGLEEAILQEYKENIKIVARKSELDQLAFGEDVKMLEGGYFTQDLMEEYPKFKEHFELYNRLQRMEIGVFMEMYDRGMFPLFKFIYLEMIGSTSENSFLEELKDSINVQYKMINSRLKSGREFKPVGDPISWSRSDKLMKSYKRAKARHRGKKRK